MRWSVRALPIGGAAATAAGAAASGRAVLGAVTAVVLALHWARARRALERPVAQWLGTPSFSLYLVHHPVLVTTGFALQDAVPVAAAAVVGAVVSQLVAECFIRSVERPSHALARRAGSALAHRRGGELDRAAARSSYRGDRAA